MTHAIVDELLANELATQAQILDAKRRAVAEDARARFNIQKAPSVWQRRTPDLYTLDLGYDLTLLGTPHLRSPDRNPQLHGNYGITFRLEYADELRALYGQMSPAIYDLPNLLNLVKTAMRAR